MKTITYAIRVTISLCLFLGFTSNFLQAQDEDVVELTLHARSIPDNPDAIRLLPREQELRDGNAAIELLRMPWEQNNFTDLAGKRMSDWLKMKGDDPELLEYESVFEEFKDKMRRAAYTRDADWDYPFGEQPTVTILLPDVQGMRHFAGRVLSLWIKIQIAKDNLQGAEKGILIQMACARHVSRTPFAVCQLVGAAIAKIGFRQFEVLIQHRDSQNFYYALSMLPDTLGDFESVIDIESNIVRSSMPVLDGLKLPPPGDARWKTAFEELQENYFTAMLIDKATKDGLDRQSKIAAKELPSLTEFTKQEIDTMSVEEVTTRWLLVNAEQLSAKFIAAAQLPNHQAIQELIKIQKEAGRLNEKTVFRRKKGETQQNQFFDLLSPQAFIGCHRFGRTVKLLLIVEAIRHYASKNDNRLPKSLAEIELILPVDPFTNKPAQYEVIEGVATLRWPEIENLPQGRFWLGGRTYQIKMSKSK